MVSDDEPDHSEEQFAASLESSVEEEQFGSATFDEACEADDNDRARAEARAGSGIERRLAEERALEQQAERWRDEVASRVEGYRQKRSRKQLSGEFSMRFDWEQPGHVPRAQAAAAAVPAPEPDWEDDLEQPSAAEAVEPSPSPEDRQPEPERIAALLDEAAALIEQSEALIAERKPPLTEPAPAPRRLRHTNLIEFPRLPFMPPPPDELADPVIDRPRILDVPDEIVQELAEERTPLGDIALEPASEDPVRKPEFDVPPQVAPLPLRFAAALVDAVVVVVASAVFMAVVQLIAPGMPHNRMSIAVGLAAPTLLWAIYHYVFLVYGASTPGMRVARLEVRTFAAAPASRGTRRLRALAMVLSFMPLGAGIAWALADEDMLCWHDRITRTYLARL
jgi:uncharacterized RDD family membrane protein YckC